MSLINSSSFELALFHTDIEFDTSAVIAGIRTIVVDWEGRDKEERQRQFDTQINTHTVDDLRLVRTRTTALIICRLNSFGPLTRKEVDLAIDNGADEILLPMIRTTKEVEESLNLVGGRCKVGIMVETTSAVNLAPTLGQLPLSRAYVGLHDLSIDRCERHIFIPVADGTVEKVRRSFAKIPFGFSGLTLSHKGFPLPCRLLIAEMARLRCDFSFLRRSFMRDIRGQDVAAGVANILSAIQTARTRSPEQVQAGHTELVAAIQRLPDLPWNISKDEQRDL